MLCFEFLGNLKCCAFDQGLIIRHATFCWRWRSSHQILLRVFTLVGPRKRLVPATRVWCSDMRPTRRRSTCLWQWCWHISSTRRWQNCAAVEFYGGLVQTRKPRSVYWQQQQQQHTFFIVYGNWHSYFTGYSLPLTYIFFTLCVCFHT